MIGIWYTSKEINEGIDEQDLRRSRSLEHGLGFLVVSRFV
jgi:hypothetical protein